MRGQPLLGDDSKQSRMLFIQWRSIWISLVKCESHSRCLAHENRGDGEIPTDGKRGAALRAFQNPMR